jgi:ABC-type amino acid transport substrate-binding protein
MKALILLCALLAGAVHAQDKPRTLVIGVEAAAFAPHYYIDPQGSYQGYARDLLDRFAQANGLRLVYKPLPVDRLLPALLDGSVDAKYPDSPAWGQSLKGKAPLVYSQPLAQYIDGMLVSPKQRGAGLAKLKKIAAVDGWTLPQDGYAESIRLGQMQRVPAADLRDMIRQALLGEADGAFYNVVVATYYVDNIRARPGALVFDPSLPYNRGTFSLSSLKHPELVRQLDAWLAGHADEVAALKKQYGVEANLDSEYLGMEQWKIDYLERQKAREAKKSAAGQP